MRAVVTRHRGQLTMDAEITLGPPGTGKTTELLTKVDQELTRGVPPDRIAYVTFTKRGAEEAIERATKKFNLSRNQLPYFRTLHSLCYQAMNLSSGDVITARRMHEFAGHAGIKFTGRWTDDGTFSGFEMGDRIMFMENLARVRMIPLRQQYDMDDDNLPWYEVDRVARAYRQWKDHLGLVDFTDMLSMFLKSNINLRLEVVFDDEAQDQSMLQWAVLRRLCEGARRVCIAGDDDQALYKWAGADVETLIDLPGDERILDQSWRVPRAIQTLADRVIKGVAHRRQKVWHPRTGEDGEVAHISHFDAFVPGEGSVLILARNLYLLNEVVKPGLEAGGHLYEINGHSSVSQKILDAIVLWEKLRNGAEVTAKQARLVYEYMSSGKGVARGFKMLPAFDDETMVTLSELQIRGGLATDAIWHTALDRIGESEKQYLLSARRQGEKLLERPRIRVSTIHGAKGGEADHVVLLTEMAKRTYREMEFDEDSERRVWYVGATRAKQKLTIVDPATPRRCPWL